jgi:hypothetical protein
VRVLVACEFSGIVRDAFTARGHDAWSCDLLETERPGRHYQGDVLDIIDDGWDLLVAFPPCTYLCASGARWHQGTKQQKNALRFVRRIMEANAARIAVENPVGSISTNIRKPDQIIQPWMFGHGETKTTCLWLKNLRPLAPTDVVDGRRPRVHYVPDSAKRWRERNRTYAGIAEAMADQWGSL